MNKQHDVVINEPRWSDPAEYFSFEIDRGRRKITAIARDCTGDMTLLRITAEQARKVVHALEAAIDDLEAPQVGDTIDSEEALDKLPDGSILRSPVTGSAHWRSVGYWFSQYTYSGRTAGDMLSFAGGALELLHIGGSK